MEAKPRARSEDSARSARAANRARCGKHAACCGPRGMRAVQIWLPGCAFDGFAAEARRQSAMGNGRKRAEIQTHRFGGRVPDDETSSEAGALEWPEDPVCQQAGLW